MQATIKKEKTNDNCRRVTQASEQVNESVNKSVPDSPENGLKGLKHWRQDMMAGLVVALVSVPLSLGIALASGAPPICGLTSEIVAGLIFPFIGGAYVSISGPAAGLAPVLFAGITTLGHGDMNRGYHMMVGVIMLAGLVQLLLTYFKAARFCNIFPLAAIHGMLAAIGFLIIGKQLPNFIGHEYHTHEFFAMLVDAPSMIARMTPSVFAISSMSLVLLMVLTRYKRGFLGAVPPQLVVVLVGIALGQLLNLDGKFLVHIPQNPLEHGFVMPDFRALFADWTLVPSVVLFVVALTLVDGTESLATMQAVDRIDPYKRRSNPDRTLFAMGISNICSSLVGGLTIIPGMIKSTTCIVSGGRTAWVNFYNALFLIAFLLLGTNVINMIPVGVLSAVLVHIGYKLAGPQNWRHVASLGREQLAIFSTTVVVTLLTDLIAGITAGIAAKAIVLLWYEMRLDRAWSHERFIKRLGHSIAVIFKSPIRLKRKDGGEMHVYFSGALTCFNSLKVRAVLDRIPDDTEKVILHFTSSVVLIDHSMLTYLDAVKSQAMRGGWELKIEGMATLKRCTADATSMKYRILRRSAAA